MKTLREKVRNYKTLLVQEALQNNDGKMTEAAKELGIARDALWHFIRYNGTKNFKGVRRNSNFTTK